MSTPPSALIEALTARGIVDPAQQARLRAHDATPWWLQLLQTLAAWIASLLILSAFMLPMAIVGDSPPARALAGAVLCGAALWLFRRGHLFTMQMALAFSLAGQALLVSAVGERWDAFFDGGRQWAVVGAMVAAGMMLPRTSVLHRTLCGLLLLFDIGHLLGRGAALEVYGIALTAIATLAWLSRRQWAAGRHGALLGAAARAAALAALAVPAAIALRGEALWGLLLAAQSGFAYRASVLSIGVALVCGAVGGWLLRDAAPRTRSLALAAGLALALAAQPAPGLIVAAALFLAGVHAGHRLLAAVAAVAAVLYLGEYYYRLDTTLALKSALLAASGLVLLGLRRLLGRPARERT